MRLWWLRKASQGIQRTLGAQQTRCGRLLLIGQAQGGSVIAHRSRSDNEEWWLQVIIFFLIFSVFFPFFKYVFSHIFFSLFLFAFCFQTK